MDSSELKNPGLSLGAYSGSDYEFEKSLHLLYGDRYYLQASQADFRKLIVLEDENYCHISSDTKAEFSRLLEIAKRALEKGEFDIADKSLTQAIKSEKLTSNDRSVEPYLYLAKIHEKRADDKNVELLQRQRFLLQAAALYNFVFNFLKTARLEEEQSIKIFKTVSRELHDIQDSLVSMTGGNPLRCSFDSDSKRKELNQLRLRVKDQLENIDRQKSMDGNTSLSELDYCEIFVQQAAQVKELCKEISKEIKEFLAEIIKECVEVLGDPPCDYEMIVLGSLARSEMTPYSDFEWAILTSSDEEESKVFFRNLTNLVQLQVINLGETILPSMDIKALKTDWFFDDVTPRGLCFDAFLPQACKTPLGNITDFELIHSPKKMAEFQDNSWYKKNPGLAEILLTVAPLEPSKDVLVNRYKKEVAEILSMPCDLHEHDHGASLLTRGACRGFESLRKDVSRYSDAVMTGDNEFDEGKLYDVKKEIYRLTDRVVSGLGNCFGVQANGAFEVIDELLDEKIISSTARDNLASASAIGLKLRISTYLKAGKQGEELRAQSADTTGETMSNYHMLQDEELFHFFYVAIPLYEELRNLFLQKKSFIDLPHVAYFDSRDANKASIFSRVLNYTKAVECYERALQTNPDSVNMEIRLLRLLLIIDDNTEPIRQKLDCLLEKILGDSYSKKNEDTPNDAQLEAMLSSVYSTELRQLLEILIFLSSLQPLNWHSKLAEMIFSHFMSTRKVSNVSESKMLMMDFGFSSFYLTKISNWQGFDAGITELSAVIDSEGVSTTSIRCLNKLAEFYFIQGKYDRSYKCLKRALTMERTLYGTNPSLNVMKTLHLLGMISIQLFMFMEAQFYLEHMLQQFESFDGARPRLMHKQAYLQLAVLCSGMDRGEEAISHLQKGLELSTDRSLSVEQNFDCIMQCEMAKLWHALNDNDEAKKCILNAKDYLPKIVATESRVVMACHVAMTFHELGTCNEAVALLKEEIQLLDAQSHPEKKPPCLISLARICNQKCQTVEAETHYNKALEIITNYPDNNSVDNALECLLEMSDILTGNGKPLEGRKKLEDAKQYVLSLSDRHKKCNVFKELGERWERFGEIHSAAHCYCEALSLCTNSTLVTNIPLTEFLLELKLGDLAGKGIVGARAKEYESYVTKEQRLASQRKHYDRAGLLLQDYCTRGNFDTLLIELFLLLANKYINIDVEQMERILLNALEMSDALNGPVSGNDMVSLIMFRLFSCYLLKSEFASAADAIERSLRIEMDEHSSDCFHPHICHRLAFFSWLHIMHSPTSRDTGELLVELFQSGLNHEGFANSSVTAKANAAHCFTFLSLIFWCYHDLEQAELFNRIGLKLFEQIKELGIPECRSSSRVVCCKIKKILEEPDSQVAVAELLQFLALQFNNENDIWGFLKEHSTRNRVRNIFESIIPSYLNAKDVDMSSLLPKFISLYDQYSDHPDVKSRPLLSFNMELLRQFSRQVYGENPVMNGKTLGINDLLEMLPAAKNLVSSVFSSEDGTPFLDKVKEDVADTSYGAVTDYNAEDLLTNSLNMVSALLANATNGGSSSVLGSLLSGVCQSKVKNESEMVPASIDRKVNVDFVAEKESDSVPSSICRSSSDDPLKDDDKYLTPPSIEKDNIHTAVKDKDSEFLSASMEGKIGVEPVKLANESVSGPPSICGKPVGFDLVKEDKNSPSMSEPALTKDVHVDSKTDKNRDDSASPNPTVIAMDVLKNLVTRFFGNHTNTSVSLTNKGNSQRPVLAQESKKIEPCFSDTSPNDELHGGEDLSRIETIIDDLFLKHQTPSSARSETQHSTPQLEDLTTLETYANILENLKQKHKAMRSMIPAIGKLRDSGSHFLKAGEFQKHMEVGDNLSLLIKSFVELAPNNTCIENCLTKAAEKLKNHQTNSARSSLTLAAQFPRSERQDARISKMRGDCYLLEGSYRLAAINFTRAAEYYSGDSAQERGDVLEYLETLVGLINAHMLCQKENDAWQACQVGVAVLAQLEAGESIAQRTIEFCCLSAKCLARLSKSKLTDGELEKGVAICQQGLAASKIIDEKVTNGDLVESLGSNGELFAVKYEIQLLLAANLQQLSKQEEAERILTDVLDFLVNVAVGFETFTAATWDGGELEFFKLSCRLFSCIGQAFLMNGEALSAIAWLEKALLAFVSADRMDILSLSEQFIPLLDAITVAKATLFPQHSSSFQQTVDMYKGALLEKHGDVNTLYEFLLAIGFIYMDIDRASEAIVLYENALSIAECMSDSLEDQRKRALLELHLGHAHRLRSINNTGRGRNKERDLARKYYETGDDTDLHFSTLCKKITLACWLLEENEFAQAIVLLQELLKLQDKLVEIPVAVGYFSRSFYGPIMQNYIEEHGESTTILGCLVYSLTVFVYIGMGMTQEAVLACEKLSSQPAFGGLFITQPSVTTYLLAACHRKLSSLVTDRELQNCDCPLSPVNLAKLYYELKEYELAIKYCLEILKPVNSPPGEKEPSDVNTLKLNCLCIAGNICAQTGNLAECYSFFTLFLEILHKKEEILELKFDKQSAILNEYSFADRFYIFRSLGVMCARRGNTDGAMKCYEKCLEEDEYLESRQDLIGTLAELYQSKALLAKEDKTAFTYWTKLAHDLYARLLQHTTRITPFVESSYGWFLCKCDRHREAIDHFHSVIESTEDTTVSFAEEDKPLLDVYLGREIDVRGSINLPLKVFVYHQLTSAYLEIKETKKAQESALTLESYTSRWKSSTDYPLILSVVGYTYKLIGNEENAVRVFVSVLEKMPEHPPIVEALESYFLDLD